MPPKKNTTPSAPPSATPIYAEASIFTPQPPSAPSSAPSSFYQQNPPFASFFQPQPPTASPFVQPADHRITITGNSNAVLPDLILDGTSQCHLTMSGNSHLTVRNLTAAAETQINVNSSGNATVEGLGHPTIQRINVAPGTEHVITNHRRTKTEIYCCCWCLVFFVLFWLALYDKL